MELDITTYSDLSIFEQEEEYSIFHHFNHCATTKGRQWMEFFFRHPLQTLEQIREREEIIRRIREVLLQWPSMISNGTVMVLEKFYDAMVDEMPYQAGPWQAMMYKWFHGPDFGLVKYTLGHFRDFIQGLYGITQLLDKPEVPVPLRVVIEQTRILCNKQEIQELLERSRETPFSNREVVHYGHFLHDRYRTATLELMELFGKLDAWYGLAKSMEVHGLHFPEWMDQEDPHIEARGLCHLLLKNPVSYEVSLDPKSNFLFLTGANMAGKSTFIKAVGVAVFLAHIGVGVPATSMKLTLFDGILSNINVHDNIVKGESYFFNEVQRIRNTILKINDGRNWLVLIDELFKGTNIQDAMRCSLVVIQGLIRIRHSLFILSTHLYEIGEELKGYPNISFKYFETTLSNEQLHFSYQLKEGISQDRFGYLILKREKVIDLLNDL